MAYVPLQGGEDWITPTLSVDPGRAILTQNYELDIQGRYRLIDGYEAFDGRPKPSEASYWYLNFDAGVSEISVDDTITGAGGASGIVTAITSIGSWAGGTASGSMRIRNVTGTFVDDEVLSVSGTPSAVVDGTAEERAATTDEADSIYLLEAISATRDDIGVVPGSGNILGVWQYKGVKYAFRNNAGGTAAVMFKSSTSGWTQCDLGRTVAFTSGGTYGIAEDDVITGATSSATATVKRIILDSGTWAGGDAAGTLVLYSQTGTFVSETLNVGANINVATIGANSAATTLAASGRYEFVNYNFGGHSGTRRMYGCDGKNKAFEWDGAVYVPITTGMATDTPEHITAHRNYLFLSFSGGSLQHSATGDPYSWSAVTGASEIGMGDEITGLLPLPNVLAVFARNSTKILYGSSTDDWDFRPHSDESGAIEWSVQKIGSGIYLDDRGVTALSAVDTYGDFKSSVLSKMIDPFFRDGALGRVQCSIRVKEKNQYRIFFTDKSVLTLTLDGSKVVGFTRQLYDVQPTCCCSSEDTDGEEELFFGASNGYVYQLDSGTSFSGEPITAVIKFHFNHLKSPSIKKRIRRIILELDSTLYTYLNASVEFDYGDTESSSRIFLLDDTGGIWDVDDWDQFVWSGKSTASAPLDVDGTGQNFSLTVYYSGEWELQEGIVDGFLLGGTFTFDFTAPRSGLTGSRPHTIQGYTVHYDTRGVQR